MSDTQDALDRARRHLRNAALEGLEAAGALLDAATRATGIEPGAAGPVAAEFARQIERLLTALRRGEGFELPAALTGPLASALNLEIERWERRSQNDPDARPVLRAFLGLRELLFELGVRDSAPESAGRKPPPSPPPSKRPRVQRFDVEG